MYDTRIQIQMFCNVLLYPHTTIVLRDYMEYLLCLYQFIKICISFSIFSYVFFEIDQIKFIRECKFIPKKIKFSMFCATIGHPLVGF